MSTSNETETTQEASNAIIRYEGQQELEEDTEMEVHQINFKIWENNRLVDQYISTEMDRPQIEDYIRDQVKTGMALFNTNGRALNENKCYDAVVRDRTKTIIFVPRDKIDITRPLIISVGQSVAISMSSKRRNVMLDRGSEQVMREQEHEQVIRDEEIKEEL